MALVSDLLPMVRRLNPPMPSDQVLEMAESMAELSDANAQRAMDAWKAKHAELDAEHGDEWM